MKLISAKELKKKFCNDCFLPDWVRVLINTVINDMPDIDLEPKWISVEDKEPEKEGNYLVVYKGETKLAHWSGRGGSTWPTGDLFDVLVQDGRYHADTFGVTHWMSLPQPPKGVPHE